MAKIQGRFQHVIYSPRGGIEGVLVATSDGLAQIVFAKHDEESPLPFESLQEGQDVVIESLPAAPSPKGTADHGVYDFVRLVSVDGKKPEKRSTSSGADYEGTVVRFNYARHGEVNGVVLDTGDFLHTKPEGMKRLKLRVGDRVEADGDAQMISTGKGWAVEATTINGKAVRS